ncbi:hypothetical protein LIA77_09727 [Sarocladium implicatum]|nr:hypothetical protein LIA77_09727 [Sarocladium implicatum]
MESLSREILDMILDHALDGSPRGVAASYATVSRKWQIAIEARTMRNISTRPGDQFQKISTIFSAKSLHRRAALRSLHLRSRVPTRGRTSGDADVNDAWFEDFMSKLFQELKSWEEHPRVSTQGNFTPLLRLGLEFQTQNFMDFAPTSLWRFGSAFLNFRAQTPVLPQISMVVHLETTSWQGMYVHPAALCHIATSLPSLEEVNYEFHEPSLQVNAIRGEPRQALTDALRHFKTKLPRLSRLSVREPPSMFEDMLSRKAVDLATVANGVDRFSQALRELCEAGALTDLVLSGIPLSAGLFMSTEPAAEQQSLTMWPSMKGLEIDGSVITVNGQWFRTNTADHSMLASTPLATPGHPDAFSPDQEAQESSTASDQQGIGTSTDEDDTEHLKSIVPGDQVFNSFVEIMMRTATRGMPSLEKFRFAARLAPVILYMTVAENIGQAAGSHTAFLHKPVGQRGIIAHEARKAIGRRSIAWVGSEVWEIPEPVMEMCREWVGETGLVRLSRYQCRSIEY